MFARLAGLLVLTSACTPVPPPPGIPPATPVLEGDGVVSYRSSWLLRGTAREDTIVRLYVDDACRGPSLRDLTAPGLSEGVLVELVHPDNTFASIAIDALGGASACSAPIYVRHQTPQPASSPQLSLSPSGPTRSTRFVITAMTSEATAVRLFEGGSCAAASLLATLSASDAAAIGFDIEVEPNVQRLFSLNALNVVDEPSGCEVIAVLSDQVPPDLYLRIRSPNNSPERKAFLDLGAVDARSGSVFFGLDCSGPVIATCADSGCRGFQITFPALPQTAWSASAIDSAGNASECVAAPELWLWDALAAPPAVELEEGYPLRGLVPVSAERVRIFQGPSCDAGIQLTETLGAQLAGSGVYLSSGNPGPITAFGESQDRLTRTACSNAVQLF